MSHNISPRFATAAVTLLVMLGANVGKLRAQEAVSPALQPNQAQPVTAAAQASTETANPAPAQAGPRVTPPLESYQGTLPQSKYATMAPDSEGSRHTIVLSTLALVLIGVIVVLLAT